MSNTEWKRTGTDTFGRAGEEGMTTVEYALGTMAAAGFAVVLMKVLSSDAVAAQLTALVERALSTPF